MRRVTLTVFFCLAACGGTEAVKQSPSPDTRSPMAERQAFLLGTDAAAVIASFARNHSEQAIDACLNAWVEDVGPSGPGEGPIEKPDVAGLRGFLAECLAGSGSGDLKNSDAMVSTPGADQRAFRPTADQRAFRPTADQRTSRADNGI